MLTKEEVAKLFKNEQGHPLFLTDNQLEIFNIITERRVPRVHLMAHTRYGKSLVVAIAVLMRVATFAEKWAIVAPTEKKARIIMGYLIDHIFDNDYFKLKFQVGKEESLERIRRERSKNRINFLHPEGTLGEVFVVSADTRNRLMVGDSLMGFGAPNVVLDEAALIDNDIESKIFRMLGDSTDNFYLKIGNPFKRNHFLEDSNNPSFLKMNIDYNVGLKEGRITPDFIEEARGKPFFSVLYENKFPEEDAIDNKGWSQLVTDREYESALVEIAEPAWFGEKRLGVDVARGGGNQNVWTLRTSNFAKVLGKNYDNDLMSVTGTVVRFMREFNIPANNVFVDDTGAGGGVTDRLKEQKYRVNGVVLGAEAREPRKFINRRAQNSWELKEWLNGGGKLNPTDDWREITKVKYKASDSQGRLKIMSKDEMRANGIESPDTFDSLMLTFDRHETFKMKSTEELFRQKMKVKKKHKSSYLKMA